MIRFRSMEPADFPALARLSNRVEPWSPPMSADDIAHFRRTCDHDRPFVEIVGEERRQAVAYGVLAARLTGGPMRLFIGVDEEYRRRGIGTHLLRRVTECLDQGEAVETSVSEPSSAGVAFALHHGFEERYRQFPSVLDLAAFDPARFDSQRRAAEKAGLRFATFAAVDGERMRHALHELHNLLMADVPTPEPNRPLDYRQWAEGWLERPGFRPHLLALVLAGETPVALSHVSLLPDGSGHNPLTGVARAYRGRGLGLAVKVEALRCARAAGLRAVSTHNHTTNAPMLAINQRLGFKRQPGLIGFVRSVAAA
jgi:ribosomal protein S18 acetylase RimI-like enzyme